MKSVTILLIVCLGAGIAAQEQQLTIEKTPPNANDAKILKILEENSKTQKNINENVLSINNNQKSIDSQLKKIADKLSSIEKLEKEVQKLEKNSEKNFKNAADGLKNLTSSIKSAENRTDTAITNLGKGQLEIKRVLIAVDANQNKYERELNRVSRSVHDHITSLDNLLKQSVLQELVSLGQTAKKLESSQKRIESKIGFLDELTALSGITANKLQLLEQGVHSLNASQQLQLAAISGTVHQVGSMTWQIDNKLGVLLSTQKNIERGIEECKKCHGHNGHNNKDHYHVPDQSHGVYDDHSYGHKDMSKSPASSDYSNAEEASYLYQLWYGKDPK